ncbi:ribose-phosphate diphosphokinase [Nocardia ninae]|uniref:ribose-phosphate diphosphokinase n=1 Tax=Nocardia ninae NBRC 108245 TaxID=1210091 RepID=A0A511MLV1_9NOCA|nr:ribose-phosphate pyrophosphokinase [Nocardia ninae NBRC 108245]
MTCLAFETHGPRLLRALFDNIMAALPTNERLRSVDRRFPDGEVCVEIARSLRGRRVLACQILSVDAPFSDNELLALLATIHGCKTAGAERIIVFVPFLAYSRQDRPDLERGRPATTELIGRLLRSAGADAVVTIAAGATQRIEMLYRPLRFTAVDPIAPIVAALAPVRPKYLVAPDGGAVRLAEPVAERLGCELVVAAKQRVDAENVVLNVDAAGIESDAAPVAVVDDLVASAGTIVALATELRRHRPALDMYVACSHLRPTPVGIRRINELYSAGCLIGLATVTLAAPVEGLRMVPHMPPVAELATDILAALNTDETFAEDFRGGRAFSA